MSLDIEQINGLEQQIDSIKNRLHALRGYL
jgi:hypothetical protein